MEKINETNLIGFIEDKILKDKHISINKRTLLFKEHILDSMNILDIIGFIEDKIGRKVKDDELIMENFKNVNSIIGVFSNG
jgi:acyl carrier protein